MGTWTSRFCSLFKQEVIALLILLDFFFFFGVNFFSSICYEPDGLDCGSNDLSRQNN